MSAQRVAVVGLFLLAGVASAEASDPFSFQGRVEIGRPPRAVPVTVSQTGERVELSVEGSRVELPIASPQRADVQALRLAGGTAVGLVRVTAAESREAAALLVRRGGGRVEILWSGSLDPKGDPGERRGNVLDVQDSNGDGHPDVVVGEYEERARICGQKRTLLRARSLDETALRLVPSAPSRVAERNGITELKLSPESPGPTGAPLLRSLRITGVSSQPGNPNEPWLASTPTALTDSSPKTYWSEGQGLGGRGEFATFNWDGSGFGIRALAIVPVPADLPSDRPVSVARSLWLIGEDGAPIKLVLPEQLEPGRRYWAKFEKPLDRSCLSVVFEDLAPLRPGRVGPAVLADVEAYTDLDFGGGVDALVSQLVSGGSRAGSAAHLLSTLGPAVVGRLEAAWPTLTGPGRRRVVRVIAPSAEIDASARSLLQVALKDSDAEVSTAAFKALVEGGPQSRAVLAPRILEGGAIGDVTALALAREAPAETLTPLLAALGQSGVSERTGVREAIAVVSRARGANAIEALRAWVAGPQSSLAGRLSLALALASVQQIPGATALAVDIVNAAAPQAETFEDRWRLILAARLLPPSEVIDARLAALAKDEERWMLRASAIEALAEHKAPATKPVATSALRDRYPRVRAAAATALAPHQDTLEALSTSALRDRWPMVRVAALESLAAQPGAEPVLRKGVGDRSRLGRAAAIRGLTQAQARGAWPLVKKRLEDKEEWPEVLTAGVRFARDLCLREAEPTLLMLLRRGVKPDAWEPDADLGLQALTALLEIGGEGAKSATQLANGGGTPPAFKATLDAARTRGGPACAARP